FIEADYFLFLREVLKPATLPDRIGWRAWSTVHMEHPARFIRESTRQEFAEQFAFPDILEATSYDHNAGRKMLGRMCRAGELVSPARGLYTTANHTCLVHSTDDTSP